MNQRVKGSLIYLTSGAGGMFCGSCMHDNALARALAADGWDIQLVPTYTPIRTDESDHSVDQVFFGGINVYLQQKIPLFRYVPAFLDRVLDNPWLIRRVTSRSMEMDEKSLGNLAVSMLKGKAGNQRKEVDRLCNWLLKSRPDAIVFTNILIGGCIPEIKRRSDVPILVTLQGDDVFLDSLGPSYKSKCIEQIRLIADQVDGFIVHTNFFRDYMTEYFGLDKSRIHVTPLGIETADYDQFQDRERQPNLQKTIGYLARLAPEKGFHLLVDAFIELKKDLANQNVKLVAAGWLGPDQKDYAQTNFDKIESAGFAADFQYLGAVERDDKLKMLAGLDLLSVPTVFKEPKGIYALEAMAAGIPVLQPDHGCFPELIEQSGGGELFEAGNTTALASHLSRLIHDHESLRAMGIRGQGFVHHHRNSGSMAAATTEVLAKYVS